MTHPSLRNLVRQPGDAGGADVPADFRAALAALAAVRPRAGIVLRQTPAPARLAPFSYALAARIDVPDDDSADDDYGDATARFIVLHDPAGHDAWNGTTRIVGYLSATVESVWANDEGFTALAWNWLPDALAGAGAAHHNLGGTVTRGTSNRFGDLAEPEPFVDIEMRASWTAEGTALDHHLDGWLDVFAKAAGFLPSGGPTSDRSGGGAH